MANLASARNLKQCVYQLAAVRDLAQDDVLAEVGYNVKAIARNLSVRQVYEQRNHNVHYLEAFNEVVFVLLHE